MNFTIDELDYRHIRPLLERNGFGIVEGREPYNNEVLAAQIWLHADSDGKGNPGGGIVGALAKQPSNNLSRYTLTLQTFRFPRERLHGLLTDICNEFVSD